MRNSDFFFDFSQNFFLDADDPLSQDIVKDIIKLVIKNYMGDSFKKLSDKDFDNIYNFLQENYDIENLNVSIIRATYNEMMKKHNKAEKKPINP